MVEGEEGAVQGEGHQSSGHHITPQLDDITLLIYNREKKNVILDLFGLVIQAACQIPNSLKNI